MLEENTTFKPDWVSPPGDTILDLAEEKAWTQGELAKRLGYTDKHLSLLVNGKVSLTIDAAARLERVLGGSIEFWMNREANFQRHKARLKSEQDYQSWVSWLDELPVRDLMAIEAIPKLRDTSKNKAKIVEHCLRFFGVASPNEWQSHYGDMAFSFQRSQAVKSDVGAITAWLRLGEQQAESLELPKYDKRKFELALEQIRPMALLSSNEFLPQMKDLLNQAGLCLALVPAIPTAGVSSTARWLSPTKPLVQLSFSGQSNDEFWFAFFHEATHILLHAGNSKDKKTIFLDNLDSIHSDKHQEQEDAL